MKKIKAILEQLKQYRQEGKYWSHYSDNIVRIIFGREIIDYTVISHENAVVHSSDL